MAKNKKTKYAIDNIKDHDDKESPIDQSPESREKKTLDYIKMHDKKPMNRRQFLEAGLIQFGGFLALPPITKILGSSTISKSSGVVCDAAVLSDLPALITLNLAGGAGLSANWMPRDSGLSPLPSYTKMGWGNAPQHTSEFANQAWFFSGSPFLAGLKGEITDSNVYSNTNFVGVAVRSQDDSGGNKFDITGLTKTAGLTGTLLANLGTQNTVTGNNTQPAFLAPPAPLIVGRYDDIIGALSVAGPLSGTGIKSRVPAMFSTILSLNTIQTEKYAVAQMNYGDRLNELMICRNQDNSNLVSNPNGSSTDPRSIQAFATIWGLQANTSMSSRNFIFGSLVFNALQGTAGSANLTIGGYDYHNGTRTTGDTKDNDAGSVVGKILASAAALNRKVFIIVTSDGSVTSAESSDPLDAVWASDGGLRGSSMMFAFDPAGAKSTNGSQLGNYLQSQAANEQTLAGASPERAAATMFANYLAFAGKIDLFEQTLPRIFSTDELKKVIIL